ncbi:CAP-associated domain-containing protein [Vagococcus teuberi]
MRRVGEFIVVFVIVLTFFYMKPVVLSQKSPKPVDELVVNEVKPQIKSTQHNKLNATGMATIIGLSEKELKEKMPNPKNEWVVGSDRKWLVYGDNATDYYQVELTKGTVSSVFVLGTQVDVAPFNLEMTLGDISEITTIYPAFEFDYKDKKYKIELTEDDMNYRPLISFDNGTYALLHFNYDTGKLLGVRYVSKSTLVDMIPYQFSEETTNPPVELTDDEWEMVNQANTEQLLTILNIVRQRINRKPYKLDTELVLESKKALAEFNKDPKLVIKKDDRLEQWQEKVESSNPSDSFLLVNEEMECLLKLGKPVDKNTHGLFVQSMGDVPFIVTNWFVNRFDQREIKDSKDEYIGIAYNKNQVLVLFNQKAANASLTTESSDKR